MGVTFLNSSEFTHTFDSGSGHSHEPSVSTNPASHFILRCGRWQRRKVRLNLQPFDSVEDRARPVLAWKN